MVLKQIKRQLQNPAERNLIMNPKQNPVNSKGLRNIFCPYYKNCLDHAVISQWDCWECRECRYKATEDVVIDVMTENENAELSYELSPSLYEKATDFSI